MVVPARCPERQKFTRNETRVHRVAGPLCAERGRSIRIAEALDRIGAHRFTAASYLHGTRRLPFEDRTNGVVGALADNDFGIELLGRGLEARRQVHRVTDSRVLHMLFGADVPDYGATRVDSYSHAHARTSLGLPFDAQRLQFLLHLQRRGDRMLFLVRVIERRTENHHHSVAQELVDRTLIAQHNLDHAVEELAQQFDHLFRLHRLRYRREAADVCEQDRYPATLALEHGKLSVDHDRIEDLARYVAGEGPLDRVAFAQPGRHRTDCRAHFDELLARRRGSRS